jgi:hypothetical protein
MKLWVFLCAGMDCALTLQMTLGDLLCAASVCGAGALGECLQ